MEIDKGIKDLKFDLKEYNYEYHFLYHEGCDRLNVEKKDGSEYYIFDMFRHSDKNGFLELDWALPRSITKNGKTEVSPLDPEIWEFIEGDPDEGPLFGNTITGALATFDKDTGKVKLLTKGHTPKFDPVEVTRRIAKVNLQIKGITERKTTKNRSKLTAPELKARDTLRDLISEREWRRYVCNGYVLVPGGSGKVYQVFANHKGRHIKVYEKGKALHELCIHSNGGVPDTDHVLNCMLLIQHDEDDFIKQCNLHKTYSGGGHLEELDGRDSRFKDKTLAQILETNRRIARKLEIPKDWIDETKKSDEKVKQMQDEINAKLSVRRGLRDIAAGRVIPAEEVLEDLGIMLDEAAENPPRRRAIRADSLTPEQEEEMNEVFYDILDDHEEVINLTHLNISQEDFEDIIEDVRADLYQEAL